MNNLKNDAYYIEKILTDLKFISKHMSNVSKDEFEQNEGSFGFNAISPDSGF